MAISAAPANAAARPPVVSANSAGYATGNVLAPRLYRHNGTWRFRYVSATVEVPEWSPPAGTGADYAQENFAVQLSNHKETITAQLYHIATHWVMRVARYYYNGNNGIFGQAFGCGAHFLPGTEARLDLYFNRDTGAVKFTGYDGGEDVCHPPSFPAFTPTSVGGGPFTEAFAGGDFRFNPYFKWTTGITHVPSDSELFKVSGTRVTTYTGTRGSVEGPWPHQQLIWGTSASNVYANTTRLTNKGRNFSVWLRS